MVPGISLAAYWDWGWGEALYMYQSWRGVEAQVGCFLGCATWLVAQALGYVHVTPPPCSRQLDLGRVLQRPHSRGGARPNLMGPRHQRVVKASRGTAGVDATLLLSLVHTRRTLYFMTCGYL